ncbi:YjfB family protein [Radiobacillus deserti]|uniref:Putative motility protein n=1 Tax=Radiobacillus deserti TaxID=2594883 RepID=A0A516KET8_9BACI|nr:YjfB family protein [Radiobacillus deserti]QDP39925.1 putative motility protein [Radiobacillus deserti]
MDVAALSMAMNQASLGQQVGIALAKKAMQTSEQNSYQLLQMMGAPTPEHPDLGNLVDLKA